MPDEKWFNKEQSQLFSVYKVNIPSWFVWPGKVTLHISYTRDAAVQFIEDYPNKLLTQWMTIEEQEIIVLRETD